MLKLYKYEGEKAVLELDFLWGRVGSIYLKEKGMGEWGAAALKIDEGRGYI